MLCPTCQRVVLGVHCVDCGTYQVVGADFDPRARPFSPIDYLILAVGAVVVGYIVYKAAEHDLSEAHPSIGSTSEQLREHEARGGSYARVPWRSRPVYSRQPSYSMFKAK